MTTVVIPAHNEESVIIEGLTSLLAGAEPGEFEVLVVCNGCADQTAARAGEFARSHPDSVRVIVRAEPGKAGALNQGLDEASHDSVIVLDADIRLTTENARTIVETLRLPGVMAASTTPLLDDSKASFLSRSYHRFWSRLPSVANGLAGRGVYAMNAAGLARLGRFPIIVADDRYVDLLFSYEERGVGPGASRVEVSPTLRELVNRKARVFRGNQTVASELPADAREAMKHDNRKPGGWPAVIRSNPASLIDLPAYLAVNATAKAMARWTLRRGAGLSWNHQRSAMG